VSAMVLDAATIPRKLPPPPNVDAPQSEL
jgi:hypothetical protein